MSNIHFFIVWHDKQIAVHEDGQPRLFSQEHLSLNNSMCLTVGCDQAQNRYAVVTTAALTEPLSHYQFTPLRQLLGKVDETLWSLLSRAAQLVEWYQSNRFCCVCGAATQLQANENAVICTRCEHLSYPRINPCIMVLIKRGNKVLLARSVGHRTTHHSLIAGFIEAGESAEAAVHREVFEEVGLAVKNLQYVCSQSWPFSHALMLGFEADYDSGTLRIEPTEIAEAGWFDKAMLSEVKLPDEGTLSRYLIEHWRLNHQHNKN